MNVLHNRRHFQAITILHTADLHLPGKIEDSNRDNERDLKSPFHSLRAIVKASNRLDVDLVLFSGDLFDTYSPSREVVSFALEQFSSLRSPTVLIPGNHDCLGPAETFSMPNWTASGFNPYVITQPHGETLEVPGLPVVVWGRAMVEHSPDFRPLDGLPSRKGDVWHLAMGHGFYYEEGNSNERSSPIHAHQICCSGWDYIALGHKHLYTDVSQGRVKAAYSGAPVLSWGEKDPQVLLISLDGRRNEAVSVSRLPLYKDK